MSVNMDYCTHVWTPPTLAAMIANLSHYLADQYDGEDVISGDEWDAAYADMIVLQVALADIVGAPDCVRMLQEYGADPEVLYEKA